MITGVRVLLAGDGPWWRVEVVLDASASGHARRRLVEGVAARLADLDAVPPAAAPPQLVPGDLAGVALCVRAASAGDAARAAEVVVVDAATGLSGEVPHVADVLARSLVVAGQRSSTLTGEAVLAPIGEPGTDARRIELRPRRHAKRWALAAVAVAAWAVVAAVVAMDGEEQAAPATTTATTATTSAAPTTETATTATTLAPAGAPLLGRETGWYLLVAGSARSTVIDLDTGARAEVKGMRGGIVLSLPNGVVVGHDRPRWHASPFGGDPVDLPSGRPMPAGRDHVWVSTGSSLQLVRLEDGLVQRSIDVPEGAYVLDVIGEQVVLAAGGDTYLAGGDEEVRLLARSAAVAVVEGHVLVESCDARARCSTEAIAPDGQRRRVTAALEPLSIVNRSPDGRHVVVSVVSREVSVVEQHRLLDLDGSHPLVPEDVAGIDAWGAAWSPDGSLFFARAANDVVVIDPFAPDGPTVVGRIALGGINGTQLAVVAR